MSRSAQNKSIDLDSYEDQSGLNTEPHKLLAGSTSGIHSLSNGHRQSADNSTAPQSATDQIQSHSNNEVITDIAMILRNAKKNKRTATVLSVKAMKQTTLHVQKYADLATMSSKGLKWNSNKVPSRMKKKVSSKEITIRHAMKSKLSKKATVLNLSPEHGGNIILVKNEDHHSSVVLHKEGVCNTSSATLSNNLLNILPISV